MRRRPASVPHAQQQVAQVTLGLGAARPGPAGTSGIRRCYHVPRSRKWEQDNYRLEDEVTGEDALAFTHAVFTSDLASGLIEEAKTEYRASKNTPERLEQHRARMAFFNGSGDSADLDPEFNPLYNYWKTWASSVQFIHSRDYPLLFSHPEGTQGDRRRNIATALLVRCSEQAGVGVHGEAGARRQDCGDRSRLWVLGTAVAEARCGRGGSGQQR